MFQEFFENVYLKTFVCAEVSDMALKILFSMFKKKL